MRKSTLDRRAATSGLVAAGIAASMLTPVATHLPGGQASAATDAVLTVTDAGRGIARTVTVEAAGRFRLVFEAAMNWGATQWYDLAFDPHARNNLTRWNV